MSEKKPLFEKMSFAEINKRRDKKDELKLSQGDKTWFKKEIKHIAYVLDLTKDELMSLVHILGENSPTKPSDFPSDEELNESETEPVKSTKDDK